MFYAALAFAAGILFARYQWRPALWWWIAVFVLIAGAAAMLRKRPAAACMLALGALVSAGALIADYGRAEPFPSVDLRTYAGQAIEITGHVIRAGLVRHRDRDEVQTFDLQTETIAGESLQIGLRVNAYRTEREGDTPDASPFAAVRYGERLHLIGRIRSPRNFRNPGAMDYEGYLHAAGITGLASAKITNVRREPGMEGTRMGFLRAQWRASLVDHMLARQSSDAGGTSLTEDDVGLLAAMLIGEQSLIRRDTKVDFQRTGAFHILVVSGMNVGILAFVVFAIAKRLRAGDNAATVLTILLSLLYAYLTDLGTPIVRAAIMLSLYLGARLLYRDRYSLNSIGTAALLILVFAPQALFDASFQLTFLSVVALGGITQPLIDRTTRPVRDALAGINVLGYDAALAPRQAQLRLDVRLLSERIARITGFAKERWASIVAAAVRGALTFMDLILVTGLLQLALALPMVYYFHRIALLGLPTNIVVIPLTALLMPLGIAATLTSYFSAALAGVLSAVTAAVLHSITTVVAQLGGLRFADIRVAAPSLFPSLFAAAAFALAVLVMRRSQGIVIASLALLTLAAGLLVLPIPAPDHSTAAEVTIIDVGQGDSVLAVSPDGKTLLVDGGGPPGWVRSDSFDIGEDVVSPYLWSRGINRLDAVALSHAHSDHMAGLRSVIANFRPRELWIGRPSDTEGYKRLVETASSFGTRVIERSAGEQLEFGAIKIRVLAPVRNGTPKHNESLVLELTYGNNRALLTGDAEKESEREFAASARTSDVLKIAHHGSATSTTPELLQAVQPRFAAISVGEQNLYGHPKPEILRRLTAAHVRTLRTDWSGALTFYFDGKQVTTKTFTQTR
jgi:competence protein ComEC